MLVKTQNINNNQYYTSTVCYVSKFYKCFQLQHISKWTMHWYKVL